MLVLFMCLFTWTYIEWCYTGQLSQWVFFLKGTGLYLLLCRHWVHCLAHGLTGGNVWTHIRL